VSLESRLLGTPLLFLKSSGVVGNAGGAPAVSDVLRCPTSRHTLVSLSNIGLQVVITLSAFRKRCRGGVGTPVVVIGRTVCMLQNHTSVCDVLCFGVHSHRLYAVT
jgi:hypothetical protein